MEPEDDQGHQAATRPPTVEDLKKLCARMNETGARYILIGGMAMNYYGLPRATQDIDFLIDESEDNITRIKTALRYLPDNAAEDLRLDDVKQHTIVRIADEIVIDLIGAIGDTRFDNSEISPYSLDGVTIPVCGLATLIKTKQGLREKDRQDLEYLMMIAQEEKR